MENDQTVIELLVKKGVFGQVKYIASRLEEDVDKGTQFASIVNFLILTVNNGTGNEDYHLVVKKNLQTEEERKIMNSDIAFKNEFVMYSQILPLMQVEKLNLFPKFYYNNKDLSSNFDILIFENLQKLGFKVTKEVICLDCKHIELALKKLAEFHALSFIAKRQQKEKFYQLINNLVETKFTLGSLCDKDNEINCCMRRGITPLIQQAKHAQVLKKLLEKMENLKDIVEHLIKPEEPFSVICHGDFCRNNMFFKYNNDGEPDEIKFFDLQNAIYSSPAIDLAFFLYMNTSVVIREKYWGHFLNIYWTNLVKSVPDIGFTSEQFLEHFAERALYGYLPTCFFVPMLLHKGETVTVDMFTTLSKEEKAEYMKTLAGDEGTAAICQIVEHLLDKKYINKFLESYQL